MEQLVVEPRARTGRNQRIGRFGRESHAGLSMLCISVAFLWLMLFLQSPPAAAVCTVPLVCGAVYLAYKGYVPTTR